MEIRAHRAYSGLYYPFSYWRTASQFEVDFILGEPDTAIEVKSTTAADDRHLKGLRAFKEEYGSGNFILVSFDPAPRRTADGINILPWRVFLEQLWNGKLIR